MKPVATLVVLRNPPRSTPIPPDWPHWLWYDFHGRVVGDPVTVEVRTLLRP